MTSDKFLFPIMKTLDKIKHRASFYADDLVIFLSPNVNDFNNMRRILDLFAGASGLITNVEKCVATPIR